MSENSLDPTRRRENCFDDDAAGVRGKWPKFEGECGDDRRMSEDARLLVGGLFSVWRRRGNKTRDFQGLLEEAGYHIQVRNLSRWRRVFEDPRPPTTISVSVGRAAVLEPAETKVVVGHVLARNFANEIVSLETVRTYIRERLGKKVSPSTVSRLLHDSGFSSRTAQQRSAGFRADLGKMAEIMFSWLISQRAMGSFDVEKSLFGTMDFTYTSHRTTRAKTFSPIGGYVFLYFSKIPMHFHVSHISHRFQPKIAQSVPSYTNCIVTLLWADGQMRSKPMMFTHDQKFRGNGLTTRRRIEIHENFTTLLAEHHLTPDQVVYLESDRHYVAESPALIREYFSRFPVSDGAVIFSDKGNAFFSGQSPVLLSCGVSRTETFPPLVHQYLSPNDNHHHGSAKAKWRGKCEVHGWGKDDSVESCLSLLSFLTHVPPQEVIGYFTKNFCLDVPELTVEICMDRITNGHFFLTERNRYFKHCSQLYQLFEETGVVHEHPPRSRTITEIETTLDGTYWSKF